MNRGKVEIVPWSCSESILPKPNSFPAFYAPKPANPCLEAELRRVCGKEVEIALGYGSSFSNDASRTSLMDTVVVVRNPWSFYEHVAAREDLRLGTINNPTFHALWSLRKANFYLGQIKLDDTSRGVKVAVISHNELLRHARGGRRDTMDRHEGKGFVYFAGRLHKAGFPLIFSDASPAEQNEVDLAFNQARIDGVWLALGLMPRVFDFDMLARTYTKLSYLADRRIEKGNKSNSLLDKNYAQYLDMLTPILNCFREAGIIRQIEEGNDIFEKRISLEEAEVRKWLKEAANHALRTNVLENIWTMGPLRGPKHVLDKAGRVIGLS